VRLLANRGDVQGPMAKRKLKGSPRAAAGKIPIYSGA
jgi:hypothetical protein